jgi:2-polyprenyl-3-methyl-5-hydroxy-6-metoxy-1,4-benzoquinol methylase
MNRYYEINYRHILPEDRDAPIIDIGCGQGDFVRYLSDLGYRNIVAIDLDPASVANAGRIPGVKAVEAKVDAQFVAGLGNRFALIIVKQMIYYLDRHDAPNFVRELAKSVADDGKIIVEIFNGSLISGRFTELKDPGIMTAYTENGLRRLLEWNGFELISIFGAKTTSRSIRGLLYRAAQRIWFALYRLLLVVERGWDDELPRIGHKIIVAVARRA